MMYIERPGYFGKKRAEKIAEYDQKYGKGKWKEGWQVPGRGGDIYDFDKAVELYDKSYYLHLKENPQIVDFVCSFAECYDNDISNIECGIAHDPLANPRHIQDISVRRALKQLDRWFTGEEDNLLEIRGEKSNGFHLNPGNVPFFDPSLINKHPVFSGPIPKWAKPDSVEAFWQANKIIWFEDTSGPDIYQGKVAY